VSERYASSHMLHLPGLAVLLLAAAGIAGPVSGRLVAAGGGPPIVGADVVVIGEPTAVRTDAHGRFVWPVAPPLPALVFAVLPDGRVSRPVRLERVDDARELLLTLDAASEMVVVTGAAPAIDVAPAAPATLLTATDLELRHPATPTQAVDAVPGVSTIGEGRSAVPAIRGLARGRTLILVDGTRSITERRAGANAAFLDPAEVRTIDIARGPGSVAYGSDAFGGVIAVRTRGPDTARGTQLQFSGTAGGGVPEQRGDLELTTGFGSAALLAGVRTRRFDDYESPDGTVPNSQWRDHGLRLRWYQAVGASAWSIGWQSDLARNVGHPRSDGDVIRATTPVDDVHRLTMSYLRPSLGPFNGVRFDAVVGRTRQRTDQDRLPTPTRPRQIERTAFSSQDVQARLTADRFLGSTRLHVGADLQRQYGVDALDSVVAYSLAGVIVSDAATVSIESAQRAGAGIFGEASIYPARWLGLSAGLRGDVVRATNAGGYFGDVSVSNGAVAGLGAVTIAPATGLTLVAQVARGFRDPTLSDRFYRGPVGRGFIQGNPELRPETSLQLDLTARYTAGPLRLTAAGYHYRISDLIERYAASNTLFLYRNRGRGELRGAELEAELALPRGFGLAGSVETSRGRDPQDRTPLDDVAPASASMTLRHVAASRLATYVRLEQVDDHNAAGPSEVATQAHTILDAGAKWTIRPQLRLLARAGNLLNARYESSAGPRWVLAPGRQASVSVVVRLPVRQ
jgi:outer membrane receptor protein involved in Fe transport